MNDTIYFLNSAQIHTLTKYGHIDFCCCYILYPLPQHGLLVLSPVSPLGIYSQVTYLTLLSKTSRDWRYLKWTSPASIKVRDWLDHNCHMLYHITYCHCWRWVLQSLISLWHALASWAFLVLQWYPIVSSKVVALLYHFPQGWHQSRLAESWGNSGISYMLCHNHSYISQTLVTIPDDFLSQS